MRGERGGKPIDVVLQVHGIGHKWVGGKTWRTTCNSNQKWNDKTCQCECRNYYKFKKDCSWNPSTCICENSKYLKSVGDTSLTVLK